MTWWRRLAEDVRTLRELLGRGMYRGSNAGQSWADEEER